MDERDLESLTTPIKNAGRRRDPERKPEAQTSG